MMTEFVSSNRNILPVVLEPFVPFISKAEHCVCVPLLLCKKKLLLCVLIIC